jgi:hypothetical protein
MESNSKYNNFHIMLETVIMGGLSMYFYKKISDLENTIEDLKAQITMQNNQIRYMMGPLKVNHQKENFTCEDGVCKLKPKVAISKIAKQVEFDAETPEKDLTTTVKTFTKSSPNPVLKSVTPVPSNVPLPENDLDKILNDIDDEEKI